MNLTECDGCGQRTHPDSARLSEWAVISRPGRIADVGLDWCGSCLAAAKAHLANRRPIIGRSPVDTTWIRTEKL